MRPIHHISISAVTSIAVAYGTRSWPASLVCFLSGILIDLDHLLDFWLAKKKIILSYQALWSFCGKEKDGRLYLIFHSYEIMAVGWLLYAYLQPSVIWLGLLVGMTVHLICDQIFNDFRAFSYFFIYRIKHRFKKEYIFVPGYYEK